MADLFIKGVLKMSEQVYCPNCRQLCEKNGNILICTNCDATYKITKTGAAKVVKLGEVEELKCRVTALEALLAPEDAAAAAPDETEDEEEELEGDILPP